MCGFGGRRFGVVWVYKRYGGWLWDVVFVITDQLISTVSIQLFTIYISTLVLYLYGIAIIQQTKVKLYINTLRIPWRTKLQ